MGKTTSLFSVLILSCILTVHAESPIAGYSIKTDSNGYDYSNSISNGAYLGSKDFRKENTDFYNGGSNGHALISSGNQGNIEGSLSSNTYTGFAPSSQSNGFRGYSGTSHDNLGGNSYTLNGHSTSSFGGYSNNNNNGDSTFEGYTAGISQTGSDINQYTSSSHKNPYAGFSENIGSSTATSYSEASPDTSLFRGYSGTSSKAPTMGTYLESDHAATGDSSYFLNTPTSEYSFGKYKDSMFGITGSNKYANDVYSSPSDVRYIRGNHGSVHVSRDYGSPTYLSNSASGNPLSGMRGNPLGLYTSVKMNRYNTNKHLNDYPATTGVNYLSKDHDTDYLSGGYSKGSGKVILLKDSRPSNYNSQAYVGAPSSYIAKLMGIGGYKSKPSSFLSYSAPSIGYSSMSNMHGGFSSSNYGEGHIPRGYRNNGGYVSMGTMYPGYS